MRSILILIVCLIIGKSISIYNYNLGFNITFFLTAFFIFFPMLFRLKSIPKYEKIAQQWLKENNIESYQLTHRAFRKGPLRFKASDLQVIYTAETPDGRSIWFSFGGYFLGVFSKTYFVFENGAKSGTFSINQNA